MTTEETAMRDHFVVCRADEKSPHVFQTWVNAGGIWSQINQSGPTSLESQVRIVLSRCRQPESDLLPDVTISTRTAASVKNVPPLVEPHPQSMQLMWSDTFTSILLKEGHGYAPRMWMRAVKVSGQFVPVGGKFVHQTLEQQILKFFSAGTQRDVGASPPWKTFAGQPKGQTELWLRPGWKAAELWPDQITVPKTPALNPKTAEHRKAYHDAMARKRKSARIMEAKGYRKAVAKRGVQIGAKVWVKA